MPGFVCNHFIPFPPPSPFILGSRSILCTAKTEHPVPRFFFAPATKRYACCDLTFPLTVQKSISGIFPLQKLPGQITRPVRGLHMPLVEFQTMSLLMFYYGICTFLCPVLQAVTVLVAMAGIKNFWRYD